MDEMIEVGTKVEILELAKQVSVPAYARGREGTVTKVIEATPYSDSIAIVKTSFREFHIPFAFLKVIK